MQAADETSVDSPPAAQTNRAIDAAQGAGELPAAPALSRVQWVALGGILLGYAALSHYSTTNPDAKGLGAALSVGPVLLIGLFLLWRWSRPVTAVIAAIATGFLLYRLWPAIENHFEWSDLLQQVAIYALIAWSFARSSFGGRMPVCTQIAKSMYGELTPVEITYTARATLAWALFYSGLALAILALFFTSPLRVWSLFVNFGTFGLMALMGFGDHAIRRRVLPRHEKGGLLTILQKTLIG